MDDRMDDRMRDLARSIESASTYRPVSEILTGGDRRRRGHAAAVATGTAAAVVIVAGGAWTAFGTTNQSPQTVVPGYGPAGATTAPSRILTPSPIGPTSSPSEGRTTATHAPGTFVSGTFVFGTFVSGTFVPALPSSPSPTGPPTTRWTGSGIWVPVWYPRGSGANAVIAYLRGLGFTNVAYVVDPNPPRGTLSGTVTRVAGIGAEHAFPADQAITVYYAP